MSFAYIVRCNFNDPTREPAWNDWYSGPKIAQMLRKPHFRSCQRFRKVAGQGRNYLALWVLESPEAFKTNGIHQRLGLLRMATVHHRLEPRPV